MFNQSGSIFDQQQKEKQMCLQWEFSDIFIKLERRLGCTDVLEFGIKLKDDAKPFKSVPHHSSPTIRHEISHQVQELLDDDIIRPSVSAYASPMLHVSRPD